MDDIDGKGVGTDFAKESGMSVHHEIRYLTFFEPFSNETTGKEKEKPGKKREIIRRAETRPRKTDNCKIFAEIKAVRYFNVSEHNASGRKTIEEKIGKKGNNRTEKGGSLFNGFSEDVINYH